MFELVKRNRTASAHRFTTIVLSVVVHVVVVGAVIILPLLYISSDLPKPNEVIAAFATSAPAPAPPPPPPPPPPATAAAPPKAVPTAGEQNFAPVVPPNAISEAPTPPPQNSDQGVPGGVPGGIAGGVAGGVVGGIPDAPPGPPAGAPVRVGGRIAAPGLVQRVEPKYPSIAQNAHVAGTVVLEATVDTSGRVQSVRVLRGVPLLNEAAIEAVKQWRYSPLRLNGTPTPFILTVTVTFQMQ